MRFAWLSQTVRLSPEEDYTNKYKVRVSMRVRDVVPLERVEEFVDRPVCGFLEVEWLDESD
jgi:hypothetical protein